MDGEGRPSVVRVTADGERSIVRPERLRRAPVRARRELIKGEMVPIVIPSLEEKKAGHRRKKPKKNA